MPRNRFSRQNAIERSIRQDNSKTRSLSKQPLRKCPSCKQDATVEMNILEDKVVLHCCNCYLRYDLTRFPAFEAVDYYNKMLDIYRTENLMGRSFKNKNNDATPETTEEETTSNCPVCKMGSLGTSTFFAHGAQIIKCNNSDCHVTFQAPKGGYFQVSADSCPECGWPIVATKDSLQKVACFNPGCKKHGVITIKWKS